MNKGQAAEIVHFWMLRSISEMSVKSAPVSADVGKDFAAWSKLDSV